METTRRPQPNAAWLPVSLLCKIASSCSSSLPWRPGISFRYMRTGSWPCSWCLRALHRSVTTSSLQYSRHALGFPSLIRVIEIPASECVAANPQSHRRPKWERNDQLVVISSSVTPHLCLWLRMAILQIWTSNIVTSFCFCSHTYSILLFVQWRSTSNMAAFSSPVCKACRIFC